MDTSKSASEDRAAHLEYLIKLRGRIDYVVAFLSPNESAESLGQDGLDAIAVMEYLNQEKSQCPYAPEAADAHESFETDEKDPACQCIARMVSSYDARKEGLEAAFPKSTENLKSLRHLLGLALSEFTLDEIGLGGIKVNGERTRMIVETANNLKEAKSYIDNLLAPE